MEELRSIILRQNDVLKRLENALANAINRIEGIERLYFITESNELTNNSSPILSKENDCNISKRNIYKFEDSIDKIPEFDSNEINPAFNLTTIDENNIDYSKQPLAQIKDSEYLNVYSKINLTDNKFTNSLDSRMIHDSKSSTNLEFQECLEDSTNTLKDSFFNAVSEPSMSESEDLSKNIKENDENDINALNMNKIQMFNLRRNELYDRDQGLNPKFAHAVETNKLDILNRCYTNKRAIFSNYIGRNASNIISSNQLYIFDEEDRSNMRLDDPPDLEIAENEFYYLKGHIKRGSTSRDFFRSSSLDNCHLFKCLCPPTEEIKVRSDNIYQFGVYLNSHATQIEKNKCLIKEIIYHKPSEKIIGYVQIPYNAFLNQPLDCSIQDQTNSKNHSSDLEFLESHSRCGEREHYFKEATRFTNKHDQFNKKFTYVKGHYPIFYRFFYFRKYPIFILRPFF